MTHLQALKSDALALPDSDRAALVSDLLLSLPPQLSDQDDGVKEALRRDVELTEDSSSSVTWSEIKQQLGR